MCGAAPSGDPPCSVCFARAVERKNPGPSPVHQRRNDRGGEENCKAAANTFRKIRKAPAERRPLNRVLRREIPRSNASFETKHRPPAAFLGLLSWEQSVVHETRFCENKIARQFCIASWSAVSRTNTGATPPLQRSDTLSLSKSREHRCCLRRPDSG